ncbi:undecaprenyl-diphosphatase [Paenibacillus sp. JX-17]|uniref:Undecaprenyl-diphosphatase n=1 Tax=Paenibacillus lacisoli TaxID=3064525 RepID=A0ABT9C8H9_9BACL|nr:undecaprenyl-diphosphatase [Paenibacillus sp. JX-17]MDO7905215.1 undecaprenyl-diphosphatase [Paenibacillus sp. JX-17]
MNYEVFTWINRFADQNPLLDDAFIFLSKYAIWIMIVVLALVWIRGNRKQQRMVVYAFIGAAFAVLSTKIVIAPWIGHPRPFTEHSVHQLIDHTPDGSFPSKHAAFAFTLAFLSFAINRPVGRVMLILAVLIGLSRVYVGVHYPADILGGAVFAVILSSLLFYTRSFTSAVPDFFIQMYRKMIRS